MLWICQGEAEGFKRIKKLELVVSCLKEQAAALMLSEQKAAEGMTRAEARAEMAEVAERELRESVKAIKDDFEVRHALWLGSQDYLSQ